jgi:hypothetical protein
MGDLTRRIAAEGRGEIVLSDVPIVRAADPEVAAVGRAASLADGMGPRQLGQTHAFSRP